VLADLNPWELAFLPGSTLEHIKNIIEDLVAVADMR
jgi:hypothetical protein